MGKIQPLRQCWKNGPLCAEESTWPTLTPYTEVSSRWIKELHIRPETTKLLEENIGSVLFVIGLGNIDFFFCSGKGNNKWDYMKLKSFCTLRETIHKMKRPLTAWEKTFAKNISDEGLISKISKECL